MKKIHISVFVLLLLLAAAGFAHSSKPVYRSITGCVINGELYSLRAAGQSSITVYPLKVRGLSLKRYEGQKVRVGGYLLPGDRFDANPKTLRIIGPCDKRSRNAIRAR
ncbi:MAG: hypothetical protein AAGU11_13835 [Syntrophobacteraceae bacterium]